jgi:hypothetical protein
VQIAMTYFIDLNGYANDPACHLFGGWQALIPTKTSVFR